MQINNPMGLMHFINSLHEFTSLIHCRFIDSNNRKSLTYSLAVNHMTDLSNDELKMMRGYRPSKGPKGGIEFTSDVSMDVIPDTWDWRIQGMYCTF